MNISHLPKSIQKLPHIAALALKVHKVSDSEYIVSRGNQPHRVLIANNRPKCDCTAASFGNLCKHAVATTNEMRNSVLSFATNRGSAVADRPVYIPLPSRTMYGGIVAGWWTYKKPNKKTGIEEDRVGIRLLVTHIRGKAWEKLDDITEAVAFCSSSFYHNEKTGKESYLFTVIRALTGANTASAIKGLSEISDVELLETIDGAVGGGVQFMAGPVEDKTTKEYSGNFADGDTFEPADEKFSKLAQAMAAKITIGTTTGDNPRREVQSPKPKTLPEGMTAAEYLGGGDTAEETDDIPF